MSGVRPIAPEDIELTGEAFTGPAGTIIRFRFRTAELRAEIDRALIEMYSVHPRIDFDASMVQPAPVRVLDCMGRYGSLKRVPPYTIPFTDAEIRETLAANLEAAVGAEALTRLTLARQALHLLASRLGLDHAYFRPKYDVLVSANAAGAPHAASAGGVSLASFLTHVRHTSALTELNRGFQPVETLQVPEEPFSAHERLALLEAIIPGFRSRGVDILAWWRAHETEPAR